MVGRDALQAADRDRLLLETSTSAGRLAGPVARASQDPREQVRFPVEHVGLGELALRDQADVLGDVGVGRACPLAVHDAVVVLRIRDVGRLHAWDGSEAKLCMMAGVSARTGPTLRAGTARKGG